MSQASKNIFQKFPVPGSDILTRLLSKKMTIPEATREFKHYNISVSNRTLQRHIKKLKETVNSKPTQTIIEPKPQPILRLPSKQQSKEVIDLIKKQYDNVDLSDIPDIDPIKLMDKHLHELEMVLIQYDDPAVKYKIIELEMKIAERLFKMRPTNTEINVNELLRKNDLSVEFIIKMNDKYPDLKQSWLDFINNQ